MTKGLTTEEIQQSPAARNARYDAFKGLAQCDHCGRWFPEEDFQQWDGEEFNETCDNCLAILEEWGADYE